ncbi:MAG: NERD domain-containing protein [Deltaproteobacteria bacterium]|jgi:hypothetical protein|nr:NERD domain-containing protein [Deltaproteobacteria bacterium]
MLIKTKDLIEEEIYQLNDLLKQELSLHQKFLVERELQILQSGLNGELNSTHFLNFYYQDNPDWAVIHDLSIENNGDAARYDHLLINRRFNVYMIESKNFSYGLKITPEGEFLVHDGQRYQNIDSPIEAGQKQMDVLKQVLIEHKLLPKRMGLSIEPKIRNYILISPLSEIVRPPHKIFDSSMVIKADLFIKALLKNTKKAKRIFKKFKKLPEKLKKDSLYKMASKLASLDKPVISDYRLKFCLDKSPEPPTDSVCPTNYHSPGDYSI